MPHPAGQETFVGWVFLLLCTGLGCIAIVGLCCAVVDWFCCAVAVCAVMVCAAMVCAVGVCTVVVCTVLLIAWIEFVRLCLERSYVYI